LDDLKKIIKISNEKIETNRPIYSHININ